MSAIQAEITRRILAGKSAKAKDEDEDESVGAKVGLGHEFVMYKGVSYGFAQGADRKKVQEAEAGERAEVQAVEWFRRCFGAVDEEEATEGMETLAL